MNRRKLTLLGLFALAISGIAPTGSMAYGTVATAKFAGYNIPVAFLLGGLGILCVAVSFALMARYISNAGASYAYTRKAFGEHVGFLTGWLMVFSYVIITPAHSGVVSNFMNVFLKHFGIHLPISALAFLMICIFWLISILGIKFTSKIALGTESISLIILTILSVLIFIKAGINGNLTLTPLIPHHNWNGIGQGMIFALLSYSGFEEITTVSERSNDPKATVPKALLGSVLLAAAFFVFISFVQIIGFGVKNIGTFVNSASPLDTLAIKYLGDPMAIVMDLAVFLSAFAAFLGCGNGCAYMLYAISRHGYLPRFLGKFDKSIHSPKEAINVTAVLTAIIYAVMGVPYGFRFIYTNASTLGMLSTLIVYMMVCASNIFYFWKRQRARFSWLWNLVIPVIGIVILMFPFISNIYPVPKYPADLYPYIVILWIVIGGVIAHVRDVRVNRTHHDLIRSRV